MAPPTRLRPHLNDLLQKNLELEHVVADLRHQLTQSSAKWADERKSLSVGCDALMASFAKFRAHLDVHPSDWNDSEGEVEQNLDTGGQPESDETGEVDNEMPEIERDQGSSTSTTRTDDLHERCRILVAELRVKEEELEGSRRKHEVAEVQFEEIQRIQRLLDAQSEQLRATLASAKADTNNQPSPERTPDDPSTQSNSSENTREKLDVANQEINRLKHLLQEWKRYGGEWKRDGQQARARVSELQRKQDELSAQAKAAEQSKALLDAEIQRLTTVLADRKAAMEQHRTACQESAERVQDLEAMVALLRAQLSPKQLASFDSEQNQAENEAQNQMQVRAQNQPQDQLQNQAEDQPQNQVQNQTTPRSTLSPLSPTPHTDTNTNKRNDMIMLKIPYRGLIRKPSTEENERRDEQQNVSGQRFPAHFLPVCPHGKLGGFSFTASFRQSINSLISKSAFIRATLFRVEMILDRFCGRVDSLLYHATFFRRKSTNDAMKEPRRAKCRPPTEAEIALAAEEMPGIERIGEKGTRAEVTVRSEGSREPGEADEAEGESARESEGHEGVEERSPRMSALSPGKRLRSRTDGEESQRSRKLRPRISLVAKP
ncbi:hypothetical protein L210DRAFT_3644462 [Boletus edulis BED1]|uniref:Uncharacterized protein n=1 Tax=Boletus edulis BED1 TaxID=1328754 RepID=A0AAD4GGE5_BOLED|nr:hypothetical protein L210DRAFT_3644462 [Boletus edulis BED1]